MPNTYDQASHKTESLKTVAWNPPFVAPSFGTDDEDLDSTIIDPETRRRHEVFSACLLAVPIGFVVVGMVGPK
jgi:hypothetical protein